MGNHHTPEYKEYVAKLILEENRVAKQLCRELDLSVGTVAGWVKKYRDKKNLSVNPELVTPAELEKRETAYEKRIRELEEENAILKKGYAHLHQKPDVIFQFIHDHETKHSVVKMCRALKVSRQGYINWRNRMLNPNLESQAIKDELQHKIAQSFHESGGTYGSPRVHDDLLDWGYSISQKKVANVMKEMGLCATVPSKFTVTTDSNHDQQIYPNILNRQFSVA